MHRLLLTILLLASLPALAGSVLTRDGKTLQGKVALTGDASLTITPSTGPAVTVALAQLQRATFENASPPAPPTLTGTWNHADLGKVHLPGSATEKDAAFSLAASGWGAWGPKDSGQFLYWPFEGDGQIIAHIVPPVAPAADALDAAPTPMAGVMFRASLDPDSPFAATLIYPTHETRFNRRPIEGYASGPEHKPNVLPYEWVRLARSGKHFTASRSRDGRFWLPMPGQAIDLPAKSLVGLFVAAGTNAALAAATFDHVRLLPGTPALTYFDGAIGPDSGVVLTDGTMLAGRPRSLADGSVLLFPRFARDGRKLEWPTTEAERAAAKADYLTLPQTAVARLRYAPEPPSLDPFNPAHAPGVLLMAGDFMECEVVRFSYGQYLDLNSVVFGAKRLDAAREVICAVLSEPKPEKPSYDIRLRDGSFLPAKSFSLAGEMIQVESPLAGTLKYPLTELLSIESVR